MVVRTSTVGVSWRRKVLRSAAGLVSGAAFLAISAAPSVAEDVEIRLDRLADGITAVNEELGVLQLAQAPQSLLGGAAGVGRIEVQSLSSDYAATVETRLQALERDLSRLTGAVEESRFRNEQLAARLERALNDIEFRLSELEEGSAVGAEAGDDAPTVDQSVAGSTQSPSGPPAAPPSDASGSSSSSGGSDRAAPGGGDLPETVRTLGTIPLTGGRPPAPESGPGTGPGRSSGLDLPPAASPSQTGGSPASGNGGDRSVTAAYDEAYGLITRGQYADAEAALRNFIERYSDHSLADNARYWLGETFYIRGRYEDAARAFARAFQEARQGGKAPDNLLKLGLSLSALDQREDACTAFRQVSNDFSNAPATITDRAQQERSRLGC